MAETRREAALAALTAQLTTALAPVPVERNRRSRVAVEDAPLLIVYDGTHIADSAVSQGETLYDLTVMLEGAMTAANDSALGPAVNDLYGQTLLALNADVTLGGAAQDCLERAFDVQVISVGDSGNPLAFFTIEISVIFRTTFGDPTS